MKRRHLWQYCGKWKVLGRTCWKWRSRLRGMIAVPTFKPYSLCWDLPYWPWSDRARQIQVAKKRYAETRDENLGKWLRRQGVSV